MITTTKLPRVQKAVYSRIQRSFSDLMRTITLWQGYHENRHGRLVISRGRLVNKELRYFVSEITSTLSHHHDYLLSNDHRKLRECLVILYHTARSHAQRQQQQIESEGRSVPYPAPVVMEFILSVTTALLHRALRRRLCGYHW